MRSAAIPTLLCATLILSQPAGAVPIAWNTDADGSWSVPTNWDVGVPGPADDVTIDRGSANPTVTHSAGLTTVSGIANEESLIVDGGSLETSTYVGGADSSLSVEGAGSSFTATGPTTLDAADLFASDLGLLDLSQATSYTTIGDAPTIEASASGTIDLSGVVDLTGATNLNAEMDVTATGGGHVDLSGVTNLADSSFDFVATGAGSSLDLSSVGAFTDTGSSIDISRIEASNGGAVLLDTTQPFSIDGYTVLRDGASSTLDTSQLTSLTNSTLEVRGVGTSLDLTSVTSFDGNSFIARDGATLQLHDTSYTAGGGREFEADGAGSEIDASSLTTLTGATSFNAEMQVDARDGGRIDLGNVTTLGDSSFLFVSRDAASVIDLSGVGAFTDTGSSIDISLIEASNGGTVLLDTTQPLTIEGYRVLRDGSSSTLDTSQLTTLIGSSLEANGLGTTLDLTSVSSFDGNSFIARDGASLTLHGASYVATSGWTFAADGEDSGTASLLDASTLTSLTGATDFNAEMKVNALDGGFVDLGSVTSLSDSSVLFVSDGVGSVVDVSSIGTFTDTGSSLDLSSLSATDGGAVLLDTTAPLAIDGYTVLRRGATSTLDTSSLTTLTNSTLEASGLGTTLDLTSVASFDGNSFIASDGASLTLHGTSYIATTGRTFEADGEDTGTASLLDASTLTSLTGATDFNAEMKVNALAGGTVDLGNVTNLVDSSLLFVSDGPGSVIDLSSIGAYTDTGTSIDISMIKASNGGTVLLDTTQPLSIDGYHVIREGATSTLDTSTMTNIVNNTIEARDLGTTIDFSAVASFDENSFIARDGAFLQLHGTSYDAGASTRSFEADNTSGGTPSTIDASSLTTLTGTTSVGTELRVRAFDGGLIDLSNASTLNDSSFAFWADEVGSLIDLSSVQTFADTGSSADQSELRVSGGGTIQLGASPVSIDGYSVVVDGAASTLNASVVTSLTNSEAHVIEVGAQLDLSSLASSDTNSFFAEKGGLLTIHSTTYAAGATNRVIRAFSSSGGTASVIDGSALLSLSGATNPGGHLDVQAWDGGEVDLSALVDITGGGVRVVADDPGSIVDLSSLTSFVDTNGESSITATSGGIVQLASIGTTDLTGVELIATATGTIVADTVTALTGAVIVGGGQLDFDLLVDGGAVAPGSAGMRADDITLDGDYEQTDAAVFEIDIGSVLAVDYDNIDVLGTATLDGEIVVSLFALPGESDPFDPSLGDTFDVLTATSITDNGIFVSTVLSGSRIFETSIISDVSGDTLRLTVAVPEPSTALLIVGGVVLCLSAGRRRR